MLRAAEINADVILLAKNIDGVYNADPAKDASAVKYDAISYEDVLAQHLAVMDCTATSLSMDNRIPVLGVRPQGSREHHPCASRARRSVTSSAKTERPRICEFYDKNF